MLTNMYTEIHIMWTNLQTIIYLRISLIQPVFKLSQGGFCKKECVSSEIVFLRLPIMIQISYSLLKLAKCSTY